MNFSRRTWLLENTLAMAASFSPLRPACAREADALGGDCRSSVPSMPVESGPGKKFSEQGVVQRFPGNTIICPFPQSSGMFDEFRKAYQVLKAETGTRNLAWLPADSYHMTVFDCATEANRRPGDWPQMLPFDASFEECNRYIGERLRRFDLGFEPPLRMKIDGDNLGIRTSVPLMPVDEAENRRLRNLRNRISMAIGVRHANHDSYRFHTSFAYYVRAFSHEEEADYQLAYARCVRGLRKAMPVIELGAPEYCLFDDMFAFRGQFRLKKL